MKTIFKGNNFSIVWNIIDSLTLSHFDFTGMVVEIYLHSESCRTVPPSYNVHSGTVEVGIESNTLPPGVYNLICRYSTQTEHGYCVYNRAFQITNKPCVCFNPDIITLESYATHIKASSEILQLEEDIMSNKYGYNVTVNGLKGGTHTLDSAIKDVPGRYRMLGQKITFRDVKGDWETYQNKSLSLRNYENPKDWVQESGITITGDLNITNNPDYEDLTETADGTLKFADKEYNAESFSGLGRVYLRKNIMDDKNVLTQKAVSNPNTIYIIQYDFDLNGEEITIPEGCVLDFKGGSFSNGTIVGNDTSINSPLTQIFELNIDLEGYWSVAEWYPEWYGAKGDGVTDDSEPFNKLDGKSIKMSKTNYAVSNVVLGDNTQVIGSGINFGFKQLDGSSGDCVTMLNWGGGVLRDFKIVGGKNIAEINYKQALLKLKANRGDESLNKSIIEHIYIENGEHCGLSVLGNGDVDNGMTCSYAWVFSVTECWFFYFGQYAIYNNGTDNRFNNLKIGGGALANVLEEGSSNIWENIKSDSLPGKQAIQDYNNNYEDLMKSVDGSAFTANGAESSHFTNIDIQSSRFTGAKFINCKMCIINIAANNCAYGMTGDDLDDVKQYSPGIYLSNCINNIINIGSNRNEKQVYGIKANGYTNSMNIINFTIGIWNMEQNQFDATYDDINRLKTNNIINTSFYDSFINQPRLITLRSLVPWDKTWVGNSTGVIEEDTNALIPPAFSVKVDRSAATSSYDTMFIKGNISVKAGHTYLFTTIMDVVSKNGNAVDIANRQNLPYYVVTVGSGKVTIFNPHLIYKSKTLTLATNKRIVNYCLFTPDSDTKAVISCLHVNKSVVARVTQPNLYDLTQDLDIRISNVRSDYDFSYLYKYIFAHSGYDSGLELFTDLPVYTNISHNHVAGNINQIEDRGIDGDSFFDPNLRTPFYQVNGEWITPNGFTYENLTKIANGEQGINERGFTKYNNTANMPLYWNGSGWNLVAKADISLVVYQSATELKLVSLERYDSSIHEVVAVAVKYKDRYIAIAKDSFNTVWGTNVAKDISVTITRNLVNLYNYDDGFLYNQRVLDNISGVLDAENAISICYNYEAKNSRGWGIEAGNWYVPSIGEMIFIMENRRMINYALTLIGGTNISEYAHWTINDFKPNEFANAIYCTNYPDGVLISANNKETTSIYLRPIANLSRISNINESDKRPSLGLIDCGFQYYDTTLQKPIWWTGSKWVDATGTNVEEASENAMIEETE